MSRLLLALPLAAAIGLLGAGRALLEALRHQLGPRVTLALQSVPAAVGFYERAGLAPMADTFCQRRMQ